MRFAATGVGGFPPGASGSIRGVGLTTAGTMRRCERLRPADQAKIAGGHAEQVLGLKPEAGK